MYNICILLQKGRHLFMIVAIISMLFAISFFIVLGIYLFSLVWQLIYPIIKIIYIPIQLIFLIGLTLVKFSIYVLTFIYIMYQKSTQTDQNKRTNFYSDTYHREKKTDQSKWHQENKNKTNKTQEDFYKNYTCTQTYNDPLTKYRQILGLNKEDNQKEIKRRYRDLVKKYHPDKNSDPSANIKFKEIVDAYEHLTN